MLYSSNSHSSYVLFTCLFYCCLIADFQVYQLWLFGFSVIVEELRNNNDKKRRSISSAVKFPQSSNFRRQSLTRRGSQQDLAVDHYGILSGSGVSFSEDDAAPSSSNSSDEFVVDEKVAQDEDEKEDKKEGELMTKVGEEVEEGEVGRKGEREGSVGFRKEKEKKKKFNNFKDFSLVFRWKK